MLSLKFCYIFFITNLTLSLLSLKLFNNNEPFLANLSMSVLEF